MVRIVTIHLIIGIALGFSFGMGIYYTLKTINAFIDKCVKWLLVKKEKPVKDMVLPNKSVGNTIPVPALRE